MFALYQRTVLEQLGAFGRMGNPQGWFLLETQFDATVNLNKALLEKVVGYVVLIMFHSYKHKIFSIKYYFENGKHNECF
jgi:hypothetical protein